MMDPIVNWEALALSDLILASIYLGSYCGGRKIVGVDLTKLIVAANKSTKRFEIEVLTLFFWMGYSFVFPEWSARL
jgi:uncharacterized membrane protein